MASFFVIPHSAFAISHVPLAKQASTFHHPREIKTPASAS
jgi:hypothetical protein